MVIIHISGASGSGKSYLGNKFLELFGNKIIVKDLDELLDDYFVENFGQNSSYNLGDINEELYQEYIDKYIDKQKKPIIFVGLNDNLVDFFPDRNDIYYDLNAKYKFYINIDNVKLVKQKCMRYLTDGIKNMITDETFLNNLFDDNNKFIKNICDEIKRECDSKKTIQRSNKWKNDYESQGYTIATSDEIYERVVDILNDIVQKGGKKKRKHTKRNSKKRKNTRKNIS